jgi:hypothetical protein
MHQPRSASQNEFDRPLECRSALFPRQKNKHVADLLNIHHRQNRTSNGEVYDPERVRGRKYHQPWANTYQREARGGTATATAIPSGSLKLTIGLVFISTTPECGTPWASSLLAQVFTSSRPATAE